MLNTPVFIRRKERKEHTMEGILRTGLILSCTLAMAMGGCTLGNIQQKSQKCLTDSGVESGTEFMVPVLRDSSAVINFCTRNIIDIKICITNVISACTADAKVRAIYGSMGAALQAAYEGLCGEKVPAHLTCAYENYAGAISDAVMKMVHSADAMDSLTSTHRDICSVTEALQYDVQDIYNQAHSTGDCSVESVDAMHEFLVTVMFACQDVATSYYPCTLEKINSAAISCYAKNGVTVRNGFIPTPKTQAHAVRMCSSKNNIQSCIKSLITKCLYEPQVNTLFGTTAAAFVAGYNCICAADHADKIWHCASTADVSKAMTTFTQSIHNHSFAGTLETSIQCSLERTMRTEAENALEEACTDPGMTGHWMMYLGTITYPCNDTPTACYPRGFNKASSTESFRLWLMLLTTVLVQKLKLI